MTADKTRTGAKSNAAICAYHETVKRALIKDGWEITDDPFIIVYEDIRLIADLGAEKIFLAAKGRRRIVVEIKVFGGPSFVNDFHRATGQYGNYRSLLRLVHPDVEIYLAVSLAAYEANFHRPSIQAIVADQGVKLLIFDSEREEITQWIN